ncbi:hypothetical protein [Aureimonas sp. ME7]|uniref:hypothetical protein n=1 Tax=Aureimonas sp. ME7 TaxID=2744252 RepID=UPI0015F5E727|nr:hypothetical protein [Aureimonas sp. ME7]
MTRIPKSRSVVLVGLAYPHHTEVAGIENAVPVQRHVRASGHCFHAARVLCASGISAHLVSACGGDEEADVVGEALVEAGILDGRIVWLDRLGARRTTRLDTQGQVIEDRQEFSIADRLTPRVLSRRHVRHALDQADAWIIDASLPEVTLEHLATRPARPLLLAMSHSGVEARRLRPILRHADVVVLPRPCAISVCDARPDTTQEELAERLHDLGVRNAIVCGCGTFLILDAGAILPQEVEGTPGDDCEGLIAGTLIAKMLAAQPFPVAARAAMAAARSRHAE